MENINASRIEVCDTNCLKQADTDNFLSLPLYSPLPQQVAVVPDGTTSIEAARAVTARNEGKGDWDETFMIGDLGMVFKLYKRWNRELPRVELFYALKANGLRPVVNTMAALGCGFDCASKNEMALVLGCGVKPEKIIYAHTCKMMSHLTYARDHDVELMTFDNEEELLKVKKIYPTARLVLRLKADDSKARMTFGDKFGAPFDYCKYLIKKAKDLDLDLIGISFHVGTGCPGLEAIATAIEESRMLFEFARDVGFAFTLLDIGGGFPGTEEADTVLPFETMAAIIRGELDKHFPEECGVRIIAEPGRYVPGRAFGLVTNISAKKVIKDRMIYHVSDCIFHSFFLCNLESVKLRPVPLKPGKEKLHPTTVYGVSMSGVDVIEKDTLMEEAYVGDWLYWKDEGGYSALIRYGFNGFTMYKACYFISESDWKELQSASLYPKLLPDTRDFI